MNYLFCYLFLFYPLFFFAQSLDYKIGERYKEVPGVNEEDKWYFTNPSKTKLISVKVDRGAIHLQCFNARSMKEEMRQKTQNIPRGFQFSKVIQLQDKVFVFYTLRNKKNKEHELYAQEVDMEQCDLNITSKKLLSVDEKVSFSYVQSPINGNLLIHFRKRPLNKRDAINHDIIGLYTFNSNLGLLGGKEVEMPYTEQKMNNLKYCSDKEGKAYLLATHLLEGGQQSKYQLPFRLELLQFDLNNGKTKITTIDQTPIDTSTNMHIYNNYSLYENEDNTIQLINIYNKSLYAKKSENGVFVTRIAKKGGVINQQLYPIPIALINQYETPETQKENETGKGQSLSLDMRKVLVQPDNSILYLMEEYYVTTYITSSGSTRTYSLFNDIFLIKINPEGKLSWMKKLPKNQTGRSKPRGLGFKHFSIDDRHYIVFLDNIKNMELQLDASPAYHSDGNGGFLTVYSVDDETGKVDKFSILDTKNAQRYRLEQFRINRVVPILDNEFIIEFYSNGKKDVLVKVSTND